MKTIADVMSRDVTSVSPDDTIRHAAELMDDLDVGALPVTEGNRLTGMVTDRDITIRATAAGLGPEETLVDEVMTEDVCHCYEDQSVEEVMEDMRDIQVRRVPVVSRDDHKLVGIVSMADLVLDDTDDGKTVETLRDISSPLPPGQPSTSPQ
ncbi:CBS domain-containing protein [Duganella sp. HH101]|uniref:CBS domain-containing protein n=1 Tax=Duganella sp. HH101 TaxID=1781066 RepID=UPI000874F0D5|nr:CBS domain-containing protein [Duganella sp. HH101]OFA05537.1 hypoxic response protein 1 [Duganella sp. HH101]